MRLCVMFSCCLIVLLAFVYFSDAASNDKPRYSETEEVRRPKTPRNSKKSEGAKTKKRPGSPKSGLSSHKVAKAKSKGCPGQCIESSAKCSSKKVLKNKCDEGYKCCLSDQARVEKTYAKRKCQTLETCNKLVGNCEGKKKGCGSNQTTYKNSKKLKYCSNKSCVCCVDSTCPTKCTKKGGVCQSQSSLCNGNLKKGKSWCGGKTCGCCLAKGACTAKNTCKKEGGVCQPASSECDGELKKDRKYCKGKSCGCCVPKKDVLWSYHGETGPDHWPKTFPICGLDRQSPINIVTSDLKGSFNWLHFGFKNYDITPTMMTLMNNGHAAQVMISQDPAPTVQGGDLEGKYTFLQFHFHWGGDDSRGSEHTVDGKQYPAELHLVHFKSEYGSVAEAVKHEDGLAVLGVLIDVSSEDNNKLVSLIDGLAKIHEPESHEDITPFPLKDLLPDNVDDFYRYDGSLTTPPCNEIVIWTVFKEPISMSSQQLNEFRKLIDEEGAQLIDNFRPVQPIGDRMVFGDSLTPHWSYTGETGPENWPKFFPICGGDSQSPVNIETANAQSTIYLPFLFTNYNKKAATTSLMNNGHTAQVNFDMLDGLPMPSVIGGGLQGSYTFLQFHLHWGADDTVGSEHTVDGKSYAGELHLVHFKTEYGNVAEAIKHVDGIAVLGVFLEATDVDNPNLWSLIEGLPSVIHADTHTTINNFPLLKLLPQNLLKFYRYSGSLTTPTCNEIVIWTVFRDPITISSAQLAKLRMLEEEDGKLIKMNFRPVQPLNGRQVFTKPL